MGEEDGPGRVNTGDREGNCQTNFEVGEVQQDLDDEKGGWKPTFEVEER